MKKCGIYKIVDQKGRVYIGSSADLKARKSKHFTELQKGIHGNKKLQRVADKYGISSLVFSVIEYCERHLLISKEQSYIDQLNPFFNICLVAGVSNGMAGKKHSEEVKRAIAEKVAGNTNRRGAKISEESKNKMRLAKVGKKLTEEHKRKIGEKSKGRKSCLGKKQSEETKRKRLESFRNTMKVKNLKNKP